MRAVAFCLLLACRTSEQPVSKARTDAEVLVGAEAGAPWKEVVPRDDIADEAQGFEHKTLKSAKSIGHTSVVFKLRFEDGTACAFKPKSRRAPDRFRGEIAGYRLARALGIPERVPTAIPYQIKFSTLRNAVADPDMVEKEVLPSGDNVQGALIPWIEGLEFPPLERSPMFSQWSGWLAKRTEPKADVEVLLADAMAEMVVFDYLTGNFDRMSGGNIGKRGETILFIDNDGAFLDPIPADALARNEKRLLALRRSVPRLRTAIETLLGFPLGLKGVFASDRLGAPLLAPRVVEGVQTRMEKAVEVLRSL